MSEYKDKVKEFWDNPENNQQTYPKETRENLDFKIEWEPFQRIWVDRKDVKDKKKITYEEGIHRQEYRSVSDIGLDKYGNRDTWQHAVDGVDTYSQAASRHCLAILNKKEIDPEDGCPHLWKVWWNLMAIIWHHEKTKR